MEKTLLETLLEGFEYLLMENPSLYEAVVDMDIKEKYGEDYPIILCEPAINCPEKKALNDLIEANHSVNLFAELKEAFKFAHSLGISFILIVSNDFEEQHILQEFGSLENTFGRAMFDFEEEPLLKSLFKGISNQIIKSLKVYVFCTIRDCRAEAGIKKDEEEVMVMCDLNEIVKEFRQDFIILWYDPNIAAESIQKLEEKIELKIEQKNIFTDFADLYERLKGYTETPYYLIMSRSDKAERVLKEIDDYEDLLGLYIYCKKFEKEKKIDNEKVEIRSTLEELVPRIKEGIRTRSKLKNTFPAFATNFDTADQSGKFTRHYYLKGLINFQNRNQAKGDFLKLAQTIYQDEQKDLARFEETYNEYNKAEILWWYTKESPIYRVINNCLRISTADSILSCRFVLKDLERAIREEYQQKSKGFNGIVYRGAYISADEWEKLRENLGKEIEMYGFLSTTPDCAVATNFMKYELKNKSVN